METFYIYNNLAWLNEVSEELALLHLSACSTSDRWARRMVEARPYRLLGDLYDAAEAAWFGLPTAERIAAFDMRADATTVADETKSELKEAASLYRQKFGFIFVVNGDGKAADEVLAICRARLGNSVETELQIASEESYKIIEARLNKLLEQ